MSKKEIKIPKSKNPIGYNKDELLNICNMFEIKPDEFNEALGVNTCALDEDGEILTYHCDIVNALSKIIRGYYIFWD